MPFSSLFVHKAAPLVIGGQRMTAVRLHHSISKLKMHRHARMWAAAPPHFLQIAAASISLVVRTDALTVRLGFQSV